MPSNPMNRPFLKRLVAFGLLYGLLVLVLHLAIFLVSHVPPGAVNLDGLILALLRVEHLLAAPRFLLRKLWPRETTPTGLNLCIRVLNCAIWGAALAGLKLLWTKLRGR